MRTRAFWLLFAVFGATWISVFVPLVHLVPMARGLGVPPLLAATLVSALGVAALVGRLVMGGASDRIGRRPALAVALALQAAAFVGFALARELPALYAASLVFGFSYGASSTLFPAAVADYFGREQAGEPGRAPVRAGRLDGRVGPGGGRLHLRPRRRLRARLVAQRRLQRRSP